MYGHYGRKSDFEKLKELGVDVNQTIVLIRYGKIHPSNKVWSSQGVVLELLVVLFWVCYGFFVVLFCVLFVCVVWVCVCVCERERYRERGGRGHSL